MKERSQNHLHHSSTQSTCKSGLQVVESTCCVERAFIEDNLVQEYKRDFCVYLALGNALLGNAIVRSFDFIRQYCTYRSLCSKLSDA